MKDFWNRIKNLRVWAAISAAFKKVGVWFKAVGGWLSRHWRLAVAVCALLVVLAGIGLALGLTLPTKSLEIEGDVVLIRGETYVGGFTVKRTNRAGLIHREAVLMDMLEGLDTSEAGVKECSVSYRGKSIPATVKVLGEEDVELRVRAGTFPTEFEPNAPFPTTGVFDLYYNGELFRSAPITRSSAPGFSSRLSGNYDIFLNYKGLFSLPVSYRVLEIIQSITPTGVLYAPQGVALGKDSALGNLRFHVLYKDGTEKDVMIYDQDVLVQQTVLNVTGADYETNVVFTYKGVEITVPVVAYAGELLAPKTVELHLDKTVYVVGEGFDYSKAHLAVEYERFEGTPVLLRATEQTVLLAQQTGTPENPAYLPITDGTAPITFEEAQNYLVIAKYLGVESMPVTVRVITTEDAGRVTDLITAWHGRNDGPPIKGLDLEFENATLEVEYGFGYRTETVPLTANMVTGYDKQTPGDQTVTITYGDFNKAITLRVADPDSDEVTHIFALVAWNDPTYYSSDELVIPADAYLDVEVGYGARRIHIPLTDPNVVITGFTPHLLDPQDLTISYKTLPPVKLEGFTVVDDRVKEMTYLTAPSTIRISAGEELDYDAIQCRIGYNTGDADDVTLAELVSMGGTVELPANYDKNVAGTYDMRICYNGFNSGWIALYVEGDAVVTLSGIRLDSTDAKTAYAVGESLDVTGMKLYLRYSDGSETDVTDDLTIANFQGFSTASAGSFTATVTYILDADHRYTTTFEYSVQ